MAPSQVRRRTRSRFDSIPSIGPLPTQPLQFVATRRQINDLRRRSGLKRIHKLLPWALAHSLRKLSREEKNALDRGFFTCRRVQSPLFLRGRGVQPLAPPRFISSQA